MITIDGSEGEGGGQILRSALALSVITGQGFRISNIRAGRARPGLMRQHLVCVQAAQAISGADVSGDAPGSLELSFSPGPVAAGDYRFAIGTAGSTGLVLQTVLVPLALAGGPSTLRLTGGTHNIQAPPFEFLEQVFLLQLARMGFSARISLLRHGFHPAGGGEITAEIGPVGTLSPLEIMARGAAISRSALALTAHIPAHVGERELREVREKLGWGEAERRSQTVASAGPGNVLMLAVDFAEVSELVCGFGETRVTAEQVARRTIGTLRSYLDSGAPVGPHLADQLLLPMAAGAGGRFLTGEPTAHTRSNALVIGQFLGCSIGFEAAADGLWQVTVPGRGSAGNGPGGGPG